MYNSFVKRLQKSDIIKILSLCGLELAEDLPKPISRGQEEDGSYGVFVKAKPCEIGDKTEVHPMAYPVWPGAYIFLTLGTPQYMNNDKMLIKIEEFVMYEMAVVQDDEEWLKYATYMTDKYCEYMTEKFGKEYSSAEDEYIQKIRERKEIVDSMSQE